MSHIAVSIIMPSLNVAKYIRKCIESVMNQTLKNIEIICVDAGSTDGTWEILKEYSQKDDRIILLHSDKRSYGYQMNLGISLAKGEYIGIVETDDYILPKMYETLYTCAMKNNLDLAKCEAYKFWESLDQKILVHNANLERYYNTLLGKEQHDIMVQFYMFNWEGIYKRQFLIENDICHNETPGASYQDNGFWIQIMALVERAMWLDVPLYMYRQDNPASSMKDKGKMMATMNEYDFAVGKLEKCHPELKKEIAIYDYFRLCELRTAFLRIDDSLKKEYIDVIIDIYKKYKNNVYALNEQAWNDLKEWLEYICADPAEFYKTFRDQKEELLTRLKSAESIVLYGAGQVAEKMVLQLYYNGFIDKLSAIVVTEKDDKEYFWGKKIFSLDEFTSENQDTLFIVGVGKKNEKDVENALVQSNHPNYIKATEINKFLWAF